MSIIAMEYRALGSTGIRVSAIGLGGNTFGRSCDAGETADIVHAALDLGINLIDTAELYADGISEEYIGRALAGHRDEVILGTKMGWPREAGETGRLCRQRIMTSIDASLRRLRTDHVDLYYLHHPDPSVPIEESLRAMDELVRVGKVRWPAVSNYSAWQVVEMLWICDKENLHAPKVSQSAYSVLDRSIEGELMLACARFDLGLVCFRVLGAGFLSGKYVRGERIPEGVRGFNDGMWQGQWLTGRNFVLLEKLHGWLSSRDRGVTELAIAWALSKASVSSVLAGATSVGQVSANVAATGWHLMEAEVAEVERLLDEAVGRETG